MSKPTSRKGPVPTAPSRMLGPMAPVPSGTIAAETLESTAGKKETGVSRSMKNSAGETM